MAAILLICSNSASPTASDTAIESRLTGQSHTVTRQSASASSYSTTGKNLVIIGSGSGSQVGTKLDAVTIPVIGRIDSPPHSKFYTSSVSTATVSSYFIPSTGYSGDPIITPDAGGSSVVFATAAVTSLYALLTSLGPGVVAPLRYGSNGTNLPRVMGAYYPPGAIMSDGTTAAPSYRLALQSYVDFSINNANGQRWFDQGVTAALGSVVAPPTANAGPDQTHAVGFTVQLAFSGTAPGSTLASYTSRIISAPTGSTASLSSTSINNPTITPTVAGPIVIGLVTTNTATPVGTSTEDTMTVLAVAAGTSAGADSTQSVAPANVPLVATVNGVGVTGNSWQQGIPGTANPSTVTIVGPTAASTSFFPPSTSGVYRFWYGGGTDEAGNAITYASGNAVVVTMTFGPPVLGALNVRVNDGNGNWV